MAKQRKLEKLHLKRMVEVAEKDQGTVYDLADIHRIRVAHVPFSRTLLWIIGHGPNVMDFLHELKAMVECKVFGRG